MQSPRFEYFRRRNRIGKLERAAMSLAFRVGHEPFMIMDSRFSTAIGCNDCAAWGCAEIEDDMDIVHGDIFFDECGTEIIDAILSTIEAY